MLTHFLAGLAAVAGATSLEGSQPGRDSSQGAEQTPENANRFLASVFPRRLTANRNGHWEAERVSDLTFRGNCFVYFQTRRLRDNRVARNELSWEYIAEARQGDAAHESRSIVYLTFRESGTVWYLNFGSPALAARAAYAVEFLRQHCDPAAGTGF